MIDLVDEIAYNHHDIDDGLESRLLELESVADAAPIFGRPLADARRRWPAQDERMWVKIALRRVIDRLVSDLVDTTREAIGAARIGSVDDVRAHDRWLVGLSPATAEDNRQLKRHLNQNLYRHPRILEIKTHCAQVLTDLFQAYNARPADMPARFAGRAPQDGVPRVVCDYIAGMTDRYALQEHHRLFGGAGPDDFPMATRVN
jgi:dGTPase